MPILIGAEVAANQQNIKLALKLYKMLNSQYPNQKEVILGMSSSLIRAGKLNAAEKLLTEFVATGKFDAETATNIAIVASEQGNDTKAEENYRFAQKLKPESFATNYNLAKFLQAHRSLGESLQYYNTCLAIVPLAFEATIEKADILDKLNRGVEAIAIYESLISSSNSNEHQKNRATRQYLYAMIDKHPEQLTKGSLSKLLKSIPLDNKTFSLIYDLPIENQNANGGIHLYRPSELVKELQYVTSDDNTLALLAQDIKKNPNLILNRPNKPTRGGQQTHELLLDPTPIMAQVYDNIKSILIEYGSELPSPIRLDLTKNYSLSGWAVCLQSGGYQLRHTHPEAVVSAVLYIEIPEEIINTNADTGCLYFSKKRVDQQIDAMKIKPIPGKLVMFPSYLPHETTAFSSKSERICIACNLIQAG